MVFYFMYSFVIHLPTYLILRAVLLEFLPPRIFVNVSIHFSKFQHMVYMYVHVHVFTYTCMYM